MAFKLQTVDADSFKVTSMQKFFHNKSKHTVCAYQLSLHGHTTPMRSIAPAWIIVFKANMLTSIRCFNSADTTGPSLPFDPVLTAPDERNAHGLRTGRAGDW
jgi:hypothetical protein